MLRANDQMPNRYGPRRQRIRSPSGRIPASPSSQATISPSGPAPAITTSITGSPDFFRRRAATWKMLRRDASQVQMPIAPHPLFGYGVHTTLLT